MRVKFSSVVNDLPGASARHILQALADGETGLEKLAAAGGCKAARNNQSIR
jgi:hypothetical protein